MNGRFARRFNLRGPLAWAVFIVAALLGLVLTVWVLVTAFVYIAILALAGWVYYTWLRLKYRNRRLPPGY
ncbi:hypothetical protein Ocepr_0478 [Oceanithermus profundus DSM 14977]|uniref:Uncharacterized protein n=1 Tax=Oceanithermus profundus (strain DSM 14977 / NBRC 100410 / VKM B-2274 / 506) TaxID=670487 RepID=E4U664_OCEP5|nr:hypothetical protein [Oceanithermus profundus]ADR35937.1 hypothetical protein Ocepr_0478 [Oceanithermus profundus DSM 14977]